MFFNDILPIPEDQNCPVNAFVKFNGVRDLSWMSFMHQCSGLSVSEFLFPSGSLINHVYLTGSSDPPTPDSNWDGASIQVYTHLTSSSLQLNQYLSILQPSSGPALSAGYWTGGKQEGRIYEAAFSLLGTNFTTPVEIRDESLHFMSQANIFGSYDCALTGIIQANGIWDNAPFTLSGVLDNGQFPQRLEEYLRMFVVNRVAQAQERVTKAQLALTAAQQRAASANSALQQAMATSQVAQAQQNQAAQQVADAITAVESAELANVPSSTEQMEEQEYVRMICSNVTCPDTCILGVECQICENDLEFKDWGYCTVVRTENMVMYRNVTRSVPRLAYTRQCRRLTLITGWAETEFAQVCPYISTTEDMTVVEEESYHGSVSVSHEESCSSGSYATRQCCCQTEPCPISLPSLQCTYATAACTQARLKRPDARGNLATLFALSMAQDALAVSRVQQELAEFQVSIANKQLAMAQSMHQSLSEALAASNASYQQIMAAEGPFLQLNTAIGTIPINLVLQVQGVNFYETFQGAPASVLPLQVTLSIPPLNMVLPFTIPTDMTAPEELVLRHLSDMLTEHIKVALTTNTPAGRRKRETEMAPPTVQLFDRNCAALSNVKQYLTRVNSSLDDTWDYTTANRNEITAIVANLTGIATEPLANITNVNITQLVTHDILNIDVTLSDIEVLARNSTPMVAYYTMLNTMAATLQGFSSSLDAINLISWQNALNSMTNFSGISCYDFSDCHTTVGNIVQELLQDIPGAASSTYLALLPSAKQALAELSLLPNLTLAEAKSRTAPMWKIVEWLDNNGYWCSSPPTILNQPPQKVNVNLGEELSITCLANSSIPLMYKWQKGLFVLPGSNNVYSKTPAEWGDEGMYQCLAKNAIGTTPSLQSTVQVFQTPSITLSPSDFTTFEGDDSGAVFVCNATGRPDPFYEWYWRTNDSTAWLLVPNSLSNQLVLTKPRENQEGWYRCRAFTDNGYTHSDIARLTILPVSISKLAYPFMLQVQGANATQPPTVDNMDGSGADNTSLIDIAKAVLLSTLSQYIPVGAAQIENIGIVLTPAQTGLVSFTITTTRDFPYDTSIALDALSGRENIMNITVVMTQLQQVLASGAVKFEFGGQEFNIITNTVSVGGMQYLCPPGRMADYGNYLCGECTTSKINSEL